MCAKREATQREAQKEVPFNRGLETRGFLVQDGVADPSAAQGPQIAPFLVFFLAFFGSRSRGWGEGVAEQVRP